MKVCSKCNATKDAEAFNRRKDCFDGRQPLCRMCQSDRAKKYREENPDKESIRRAAYYRAFGLKRYGISGDRFNEMFLRQLGMCGICSIGLSGETKNLTPHIDHCHKTGRVRGLLCGACNVGIGRLKDSYKNCQKAAEWLKSELNFGIVDDNGNVDRTI